MTRSDLAKLKSLLARFMMEYGDSDILDEREIVAISRVQDAVEIADEFESIAEDA